MGLAAWCCSKPATTWTLWCATWRRCRAATSCCRSRPDAITRRWCRRMNPTSSSTTTESTTAIAADAIRCTTTSPCCCPPRAAPAHPNWSGCPTRNLVSNAAAIAEYLGIRETDRAATTLPMSYCYGLSVIHSHLLRGAGLVLTDHSVVDDEFWELFRRHRGTTFAGVPYTFELLERVGAETLDLPHLRYVTQAGGQMPPERVRRFAELGRRQGWDLFVMYGATEATARMAYLPPQLASSHPGTIGGPIPGGSFTVEPRDGVGRRGRRRAGLPRPQRDDGLRAPARRLGARQDRRRAAHRRHRPSRPRRAVRSDRAQRPFRQDVRAADRPATRRGDPA